ncbi:hypothetical protein [Streptomyces jumonjinensis]|uniref:hypothetical protein n=1 Tax=Streptomyces jumonjinensis TaxID=1945 RepID=UPI003790E2A7
MARSMRAKDISPSLCCSGGADWNISTASSAGLGVAEVLYAGQPQMRATGVEQLFLDGEGHHSAGQFVTFDETLTCPSREHGSFSDEELAEARSKICGTLGTSKDADAA